jgi:parallel beta-helix repeat protein
VAAGGTIIVEPGTYDETLNITQDVTIHPDESQGGNAANTILNAAGDANGIVISGAAANGTQVTGMTIENADNHGVFVQNSNNVVLSHLVVTQNGLKATANPKIAEDKAIELVGTSNGDVYDNVVEDNGAGIGLADNGPINPGAPAPAGTAAPSYGNVIQDNTISGNSTGCGIVVAAYNAGEGVIDNVIIGNSVSLSPAGIVVAADTPGTVAEGNQVLDNTATKNFLPGIILHSNAPDDVVTDNTVIGNTVSNNQADSEVTADNGPTGIIAIGAVEPVTHSIIANNSISSETYGIYVDNAPGTVGLTNNTFSSSVQTPVYPNTRANLFAQLPNQIPARGHDAFFYAGPWSLSNHTVAIAKYSPQGQLLVVYSQRYSAAIATDIGSLAEGSIIPSGHYVIAPNA